jgi:nicotinamidase-related amidase
VIDPYNDCISEGGKVWDRLKTVAEANDCVAHMLQVLNARGRWSFASSMRCIVDIALATTRPGSTLRQFRRQRGHDLEKDLGRQIRREFAPQPGDIVALEHWCSSGFANTDLDLQLKKQAASDTISSGSSAGFCQGCRRCRRL